MMFTCSSCSSFVPTKQSVCPACGAQVVHSATARIVGGVLTLAGGSVFAMTLTACYGAPVDRIPESDAGIGSRDAAAACTPATDLDADGYCGADDCDETDADINIGALDVAGDSVDSDCGGTDGPDL